MLYADAEMQRDISQELRWEPSLRDDDVAVSVRDGVATLAGFVDSWAEKGTAERSAARVKGVKAIANELEVKVPAPFARTDAEIAHAVARALEWDITVPDDRVRAKVADGWITLEGEVEWYYQKEGAERAVRHLTGVQGVFNAITLAARPTPRDLKKRIKDALHRAVEADTERIAVEISGHKAILTGTVRSYSEFKDAERAARNAPGVTEVENHLAIGGAMAGV
jgi:osmotically-inducible protein OsmY